MNLLAWGSTLVVLGGVLTAWMEPSTAGLLHAAVFALAAATAVSVLAKRLDVPVHWVALVPVLCAGWGMVQVTMHWSVYPFKTWNSASAWLAHAAVFSVAYAGFGDERRRERLRAAATWFGGGFSLLALLQWYSAGGSVFWIIPTPYASEVAGTFANRDQYAAFIELLLPVALAACLRGDRLSIPAAASSGLMFASVVASASRAGTVVVCVEAAIFVIAAAVSRRQSYRAAGLIFASLLLCTLVAGWTSVWERFLIPDLFAVRRELFAATVEMIRAKPLTGFGLGAWPSVYPAFATIDPPGVFMNHAHNDWAEWTAEGGLPFVTLLMVFACAMTMRLRENLWALGIPAVLAHAFVDFPLQKPALACAVFWMAGVAVASALRSAPRLAKAAVEPGSCERLPL